MYPDPASSDAPYRIYDIGNHTPVHLMAHINVPERAFGREAEEKLFPLQDGDVAARYAETAALRAAGFVPSTSVTEGIERFFDWYRSNYPIR